MIKSTAVGRCRLDVYQAAGFGRPEYRTPRTSIYSLILLGTRLNINQHRRYF